MNEKVLIKSENYNIKRLCLFIIIIGVVISSIITIGMFCKYKSDLNMEIDEEKPDYEEEYDYYKNQYAYCLISHSSRCLNEDCLRAKHFCEKELKKNENEYLTKNEYVEKKLKELRDEIVSYYFNASNIISMLIPLLGGLLITLILWLWLNSHKLTVTDKRVYGVIAFGKRVDLPLDSVSSVGYTKFLKGCTVSTSSGKISFLAIKNFENIFEVLNKLLIERQNEKVIEQKSSLSSADELLKYKKLLDDGIITLEEFENKKKDILK